MNEIDVALTDYFLTLECFVFAWLCLTIKPGYVLPRLFAFLFLMLALAAFSGGTWHGILSNSTTLISRLTWSLTLVTLGICAFVLWLICAALAPSGRWRYVFVIISALQLTLYLVIVSVGVETFTLPSVNLVPPMLMVIILYLLQYRDRRQKLILVGVAGFLLSLFSGLALALDILWSPSWMSAEAIYHVLQSIAFLLVFLSIPATSKYKKNTAV